MGLLNLLNSTTSYIISIILPFLALIIILKCFISLRKNIRGNRPLIMLENELTREQIPILYWENAIGRSRLSDVIIQDPTVSRDHAVLMRRDEGWLIVDTDSRLGIQINGQKVEDRQTIYLNDVITIGSTNLKLKKYKKVENQRKSMFFYSNNKKEVKPTKFVPLMMMVTLFHFLMTASLFLSKETYDFKMLLPFGIFTLISWIFFIITKVVFRRVNFELETLAIFLSGIGITIIYSKSDREAYVQMISFTLGMILFLFLVQFISNLDKVMKWRIAIYIGAIALFGLNLLIGTVYNGSQNWIIIGPVSVQPSEFIKIAFVFVGASTLDRLQTTKNLTEFIIFSFICIGALFLMGDFGTACIFFFTFLLISFMRSGDIRTIVLICAAAGLGAFMILKFKPYVANRFLAWRHVWDYADTLGYQQTRVLTYSASGGLFGLGIGNGDLRYVFASTNDLVFGMICEEMGLIVAILIALLIANLAIYSWKVSMKGRSSFYYIAACSAAGLLVIQSSLNIFGSTDILPLTGVTLPFVSLGGSSMIAVWGLLAFIKAADERTYAIRRR